MEGWVFEEFLDQTMLPIHHMILLVWQISPFQPYGIGATDQATGITTG